MPLSLWAHCASGSGYKVSLPGNRETLIAKGNLVSEAPNPRSLAELAVEEEDSLGSYLSLDTPRGTVISNGMVQIVARACAVCVLVFAFSAVVLAQDDLADYPIKEEQCENFGECLTECVKKLPPNRQFTEIVSAHQSPDPGAIKK